jgi:5,10-methylene-tetrahydrofolate dehydrogenase/methenyl tetrahydrofolate cyclohydrolase
VVVDIGINAVPLRESEDERFRKKKLPGRAAFSVVGDVHAEDVSHVAGAMTCVPGGAGPMTIAALLSNTFLGASRRDRQAA